ncbi:MAG: amidohydrolase family protein [Chloroflexi bacterium]|nr:amidohydrolase family protein [Chloroflexota bacterium]
MRKVALTNIATLVSGDIRRPILDANTVLIEDGKISKVGMAADIDVSGCDPVIDVNGMTLCPGLIDPHTHGVIGDWHPRHKVFGWMEGALQAGVTTALSQGEPHTQGCPTDPVGTKCLAILAAKTMQNFRPGGAMKYHGGALILRAGLKEADFKEMSENGVWLLAEIGGGGLYKPEDTREMVAWARKYGFKVPMHCGGESIPGSALVGPAMIIETQPDCVVHTNGGCTAVSMGEIKQLIYETRFPLEVIYNGNPWAAYEIVRMLAEKDELDRLFLGSDTPIGIGVIPTAILRCMVQISSLNKIPAAKVIAAATGNTARVYGLNVGIVEPGREADLLVMDFAQSSAAKNALENIEIGDTPSIAMIMVDGEIVTTRGRNAPQATRGIKINGQEMGAAVSVHEYFFGRSS